MSWPFVRRVAPFLSLLLLALWLPATQHCAMEAVGLITQTCSDQCEAADQGSGNGCGSIEDAAYRPSIVIVKITAPERVTCLRFVCTHLMDAESADLEISRRQTFEQPLNWVSTWHFVRRAAPSPRAPSRWFA